MKKTFLAVLAAAAALFAVRAEEDGGASAAAPTGAAWQASEAAAIESATRADALDEAESVLACSETVVPTEEQLAWMAQSAEIKTGGGTALTKDQIDEYIAKGDDCDLRIEVGISVDTDFVYQIHDYTGLRSFVSLNGNGIFYINRLTKNGLIEAAKTVANGDRVFID